MAQASKKLRILIVEDNRDSADSLLMLLEALGCEAQVAYEGPSALLAAAATQPDVILMDLGLPGMSGYETAQQIRAQSPGVQVRIVALTGWGQESDRRRSAAAGIDHHLVKPLDLEALKKILTDWQLPAPG